MKILIFGKSGQVSWELQRFTPLLGTVECAGRPEVDLAQPDSLRNVIRAALPDVAINAAAYTAVDQAEADAEIAMKINGEAPGIMAEEMKRLGGLIIHYSSDFVYDGSGTEPWLEDSPTVPLNAYGESKLAGDKAVAAAAGAHLIFRTSWVYAARGRNFLRTVLRLAESGKPMRIVKDQIGSPTWSRDIATATGLLLARLCEPGAPSHNSLTAAREYSGVYHMSSTGFTSWHGFASAILKMWHSCRASNEKPPHPEEITSAEYPSPAVRPLNSRLSNRKMQSRFGITLPHWHDSLSRVMEEVVGGPC